MSYMFLFWFLWCVLVHVTTYSQTILRFIYIHSSHIFSVSINCINISYFCWFQYFSVVYCVKHHCTLIFPHNEGVKHHWSAIFEFLTGTGINCSFVWVTCPTCYGQQWVGRSPHIHLGHQMQQSGLVFWEQRLSVFSWWGYRSWVRSYLYSQGN